MQQIGHRIQLGYCTATAKGRGQASLCDEAPSRAAVVSMTILSHGLERERHGHQKQVRIGVAKKTASSDDDVIVIKKYANRRLYNTATSSYVTLDHLCDMVKDGKEFTVHDAKTGEDITRSVLAQIIFEEENKKGQSLMPIKFLRQLIGFYGNSLQGFVPSYLELSMDTFAQEQEKMRQRMSSAFGGTERLALLEDQIKRNLSVFDSAMRMFAPFVPRAGTAASVGDKANEPASRESNDKELDELKRQIAMMQSQIETLTRK